MNDTRHGAQQLGEPVVPLPAIRLRERDAREEEANSREQRYDEGRAGRAAHGDLCGRRISGPIPSGRAQVQSDSLYAITACASRHSRFPQARGVRPMRRTSALNRGSLRIGSKLGSTLMKIMSPECSANARSSSVRARALSPSLA